MIDKIKILSHLVDVRLVSPSELKDTFNSLVVDNEVEEFNGMFSTQLNAILLNKETTEQRQWSTLWHEIIEWISCDFEMGLDHSAISILAEVLAQVIHDNFDLAYKSDLDRGIGFVQDELYREVHGKR